MNTRQYLRTVFALVVFGSWFFYTTGAVAEPRGIAGFSGANGSTCTVCHPAGVNPTVSLSAVSGSTTVAPGSVTSYRFTLSGGPAAGAGVDIAASNGTIIDTNASGTRMAGSELVHSTPNSMSGGSITWSFNWQAPTTPGTYTIYAAGMSTNGTGGTSGDSTGTTSLQVTVSQPTNQQPTARISAPTTGAEGVAVTFDGSGSSDADGTIANYAWDFGDNTGGATGAQASHAFAAGTYTVTLTVTDNAGATDSASMQIVISATNVAPTANISGPSNGTEGVAITFNGSGSTDSDGNIVAYNWDFGDSTAGTGETVEHVFAAGSYTITLMVTDNGGAIDHATLDVSIVPATNPQPPVANAGGPYNGTVGVAVQFDGAASNDPDGNITNYAWNFGDGNTGTGVGPVHIYDAPGTYTVQLTVTDNDGQQGTGQATAEIVAAEPPPPVEPPTTPQEPTDPTPPDQPSATEGETLYNTYCTSCHGQKGTTEFNREVAGEDADDILEGIREEREMAFLADVLTSDDIGAIAAYINDQEPTSDGDDSTPPSTDGDDTTPPPTDGDSTPPPTGGDPDSPTSPSDSEHDSGSSKDDSHSRDGDDSEHSDSESDDDKPSDMSRANPFTNENATDANNSATEDVGAGALHWLVLALVAVMIHRRRRLGLVAQ